MLRLNNKGFAISGILYATLILFLILMLGTLSILASDKFMLDKTKNDLVGKLNNESYIEIFLDYTQMKITQNYAGMPNLLEGVSVYDYFGNELDLEIEYSSDLNTAVLGTYHVEYTATRGDAVAQAVRTITVEASITPTNFTYTGNVQTMNITQLGIYKLEVWGAEGGRGYYSGLGAYGGKGGYTTGNVNLTSGTNLYVFVGGVGSNASSTAAGPGGYNGGGNGGPNATRAGGGGGGATDIRVNGNSLYSRVIVAGGGGGGSGTTQGATVTVGGVGGGTSGGNGTYSTNNIGNGYGGTSSSGGATGTYGSYTTAPTVGTWGIGGVGAGSASFGAGGGGGGWYGGGGADYTGGGGGGSGYVLTYISTKPSGYLPTATYYFDSSSSVAGNAPMPNPAGGTMTGNSGNGYARVTPLILKY